MQSHWVVQRPIQLSFFGRQSNENQGFLGILWLKVNCLLLVASQPWDFWTLSNKWDHRVDVLHQPFWCCRLILIIDYYHGLVYQPLHTTDCICSRQTYFPMQTVFFQSYLFIFIIYWQYSIIIPYVFPAVIYLLKVNNRS